MGHQSNFLHNYCYNKGAIYNYKNIKCFLGLKRIQEFVVKGSIWRPLNNDHIIFLYAQYLMQLYFLNIFLNFYIYFVNTVYIMLLMALVFLQKIFYNIYLRANIYWSLRFFYFLLLNAGTSFSFFRKYSRLKEPNQISFRLLFRWNWISFPERL